MVSRNVCGYVANLGNTSNIHTPIYGHKCIWKLTLRRIIPVCVTEMTFTGYFNLQENHEILHLYFGSKLNKQVCFPIFRQQFIKKYLKCSVYSCECQLRQILQLVLKWTYIVKIGNHENGRPRHKCWPNSKTSTDLVSSMLNTTEMKKWAWLKHFFQYLTSLLYIEINEEVKSQYIRNTVPLFSPLILTIN